MIRYHSQKQQTLEGFGPPFDTSLDNNNRWIKLSKIIPWDDFAEPYYQTLSKTKVAPPKMPV